MDAVAPTIFVSKVLFHPRNTPNFVTFRRLCTITCSGPAIHSIQSLFSYEVIVFQATVLVTSHNNERE